MKLLFISSDYKPMPGGIAEYLDTLARALINLGHTVKVLAVVEQNEQEKITFLSKYEKWVTPFFITYDKRPQHRLGSYVASILEMLRCYCPSSRRFMDKASFFKGSAVAVRRLKPILERENPDAVVLGFLDPRLHALFSYMRECNQSYGVIAHDYEIRRLPKINDSVTRGSIIKGARGVVANSQHTAKLLRTWKVPSDRIAVVHPPVAERFLESTVRSSWCDGKGPLQLVTVARLVWSKGIDIVLRALSILDSMKIEYHYTIAGSGPERNKLEKIADDLGIGSRVKFAGYIGDEEKRSLLQKSDIFVMVSRVIENEQHEGFGIAFMEAAACGLVSVGSRAGGIPEAILEGKTGILVAPESPRDLATALAFLAANPQIRQQMGIAAAARAAKGFSPTAIAAQFQNEVRKWVHGEVAAGDGQMQKVLSDHPRVTFHI